MAEPRVLDVEGREIAAGSPVWLGRGALRRERVRRFGLEADGTPFVVFSGPVTLPESVERKGGVYVAPNLLLRSTNPGKDGQQHG